MQDEAAKERIALDAVREIVVIPVGNVPTDAIDAVCRAIAATFPVETMKGSMLKVPKMALDPGRGQCRAAQIIEMLDKRTSNRDAATLGIIDEDLFAPGLNFVFGEADLFGGRAVIALHRLRQEFYGLPSDRPLFLRRAAKEAVHELGHVFGLDHCPDRKCIMYFSNSIRDTDRKAPSFCLRCRDLLGL